MSSRAAQEKVWERGREEDWGGLVFILVGLHSKLRCQVDKQDESSEFKISMFAENL